MKHKAARGFFDEEIRLSKLNKQQDPLLKLDAMIKWEQFEQILDQALSKPDKGIGGRPSYEYLLMFKILILQRYYNLSDDQAEYQILDRLSFMRFLGLRLSDRVPDSKTIWLFKNTLIKKGVIEQLFSKFSSGLEAAGLILNEGKIVDASFVEVPRQRNSREENEQVKKGEVPKEWKDNPHKLAQKDIDARWTKKNNISFFGYKNHIKVDQKSKLIETYVVTDASVHDSQPLFELIEEKDEGQPLYADSAYSGQEIEENLDFVGIDGQINEKGYKNKPLTESQKQSNRQRSKIRARVEHVFGFVENSMNGSTIKNIGIKRAQGIVGLVNLTYNMFRAIQLMQIQGRSLPV